MSKLNSTYTHAERIAIANLSRKYGIPEGQVLRDALKVVAYIQATFEDGRTDNLAVDCVRAFRRKEIQESNITETITDLRSLDTQLRALCKLRETPGDAEVPE